MTLGDAVNKVVSEIPGVDLNNLDKETTAFLDSLTHFLELSGDLMEDDDIRGAFASGMIVVICYRDRNRAPVSEFYTYLMRIIETIRGIIKEHTIE